MNKKEKETRICMSTVKSMGFSNKLIEELLPQPILKDNPHYKCAAPMKLWKEDDVKKAMQTDAYIKYQEVRKKRQASAAKAVQTKTDKLMKQVRTAIKGISVECISMKDLRKDTLRAKQFWYNISPNRYEYNAYDADEDTVKRWMVNYVRHNLTTYDRELEEMAGKIGIRGVYIELHNAVLNKISENYPELKEACQYQLRGVQVS